MPTRCGEDFRTCPSRLFLSRAWRLRTESLFDGHPRTRQTLAAFAATPGAALGRYGVAGSSRSRVDRKKATLEPTGDTPAMTRTYAPDRHLDDLEPRLQACGLGQGGHGRSLGDDGVRNDPSVAA
jgi:hypothetical protein